MSGSDWYKYLQPTTDVVAYAWNTEMVCVPCVDSAIEIILANEHIHWPADGNLEDKLAAWADAEFGVSRDRLGDLDNNEFPQPVTAGEEGVDEDFCGRCLTRIKDTY